MFDLLGLCLIGLQLWVAIPIDLSHLPKKKEIENKKKVSLLKRYKAKKRERRSKKKKKKYSDPLRHFS